MNLTGKAPEQKPEPEDDDPERIAAIHNMPCCICHEYGMEQLSRTAAHHCIMGRVAYRQVSKTRVRAPDSMAIPLCEGHHQGLRDTSKIALHKQSKTWRAEYGLDTDWISWVDARL